MRQRIELNRARPPGVIRRSIFRAARSRGRLEEGKRRGNYLSLTHGGIRRTFCDGLVELAHCRSESRTCLMELEPFWKFDRREQPASRSSVLALRPLAIVFFRSYLLFFSAYFETELFLFLSHSTPDSSCFSNFDLIPCPSVLFLGFVLMQPLRAVILENLCAYDIVTEFYVGNLIYYERIVKFTLTLFMRKFVININLVML